MVDNLRFKYWCLNDLTVVICFVILIMVLSACQVSTPDSTPVNLGESRGDTVKRVVVPAFGDVLDSAQVVGTIIFFDPQRQTYFSNDFDRAAQGFIPASTFKIPNSIVALETGVVDTETVIPWDSTVRNIANWNRDMSLAQAYRASCVPCYQWIARNVGSKRMNETLQRLEYPGMVVNEQTIDNFWLVGASRISPIEQMYFLEKLYHQRLPIRGQTYTAMRKIMLIDSMKNHSLRAKTGWAIRRDEQDLGWFVGYFEKEEQVYFFATNIEPQPGLRDEEFAQARVSVSKAAFAWVLSNR